MSKVKEQNYVVIQGWMLSKLQLKGNDLLIYAIIYGFSQNVDCKFTGSLQYLADWTNSTKQGVLNSLKNLLDKQLITKKDYIINGVKFVEYYSNDFNEVVKKVEQGYSNNFNGDGQKSLHNNKNDKLIDNSINNIQKTNKKEIPTISILENIEPTTKETLQVESVNAGKHIKKQIFSGQNGVNTGSEYTPEFEEFWRRYKDLCENNIKIKKNSANAGSKQDTFLQWNKVLKAVSPDEILKMIDIYTKYNLEEFDPPKHACRWLSKRIDWEDYDNQIAFFQKQLLTLKQAKQPKTEMQKLIQKPVYEVSEVVKEKINEAEQRRQKILGEMNEFEKSELEYFQKELVNYFQHTFEPVIKQLVLRIKDNKYYFGTMHEVLLKHKDKIEVKFKIERPEARFEIKLI